LFNEAFITTFKNPSFFIAEKSNLKFLEYYATTITRWHVWLLAGSAWLVTMVTTSRFIFFVNQGHAGMYFLRFWSFLLIEYLRIIRIRNCFLFSRYPKNQITRLTLFISNIQVEFYVDHWFWLIIHLEDITSCNLLPL
jgi:hypothetical protein